MGLWLGLGAALISILVSGIFDHYFFNLEFFHASTMLWTVIGLILATTRITREANAAEAEAPAALRAARRAELNPQTSK
jgi:hypothetical protein